VVGSGLPAPAKYRLVSEGICTGADGMIIHRRLAIRRLCRKPETKDAGVVVKLGAAAQAYCVASAKPPHKYRTIKTEAP
jgi:hypothetical protein